MQFETKILGGLRVELDCYICPADPDVGIFEPYCDEWTIVAIAGKPCKKPPQWLYNRIEKTYGEQDRINAAIQKELDKPVINRYED